MYVIQVIFDCILNILDHNFIVFGVTLNLKGVIIGCALIGFVGYLIFGLFEGD